MKINDPKNALACMNLIRDFNSSHKGTAKFSDCGVYRYTLTRRTNVPLRWVKPALFIMLNPSTADEVNNDPTIRRCISFAELHGCTDLTVVNLFALRSTDPKLLLTHPEPVGPYNDVLIEAEIDRVKSYNGIVVAAWGAHKIARERGKKLSELHGPFLCLGTTKNGDPRHPLYVKSDKKFEIYEPK